MTEPTDDELDALINEVAGLDSSDETFRNSARAALAKWGTPPAVAKWAPEEISDGERGIRWVTNDGIHGRPTDHDVREYLKRTPTAHGCHCDECKQFYTTPQPTHAQAGAVPLTVDEVEQLIAQWSYELHGDRARYLVRMTEHHHGIKGGQHGTE